MLLTKDLALTHCSRTAFYLDISAGGREFDYRVEPVRATLPNRFLKVRIVIECCLLVAAGNHTGNYIELAVTTPSNILLSSLRSP